MNAYQVGSESDDKSNNTLEDDKTATSSSPLETSTNDNSNESTTTKDAKEEITLLDTLTVERERGITVKASAASMLYHAPSISTNSSGYILLNMVDTPGHADFGMEVSKSLDSVEGAVLLFDAAQGVQAQTLSVYDKAKGIGKQRSRINNKGGSSSSREEGIEQDKEESSYNSDANKAISGGIEILPALTKVDMPSSRPLEVALAVSDLMGFDPDEILKTSARTRIGIKEVSSRFVCMCTLYTN